MGIRSKDRGVRIMAGFGAGVRFGVHQSNLWNLARGIVERIFYVNRDGGLKPAPQPKQGIFASRLDSIKKRLLSSLRRTPVIPREEYSSCYSGRKQKIYQRAFESLKLRGIRARDAWVNTFVKAEKVNLAKKGDPAPRVIQPRSPRYNLEVGRYLKLFEKELCSCFERIWGYRVILKGLNAEGVASQLHDNWNQFKDPCAVGLDASRFDQHVSREALEWEHSIYNGVFRDAHLRKLLSWQLYNYGVARVEEYKVKYEVSGCRMSGDLNTGMGNCLLMSSIVIAYCEDLGIKYRLSNNGDDCVLFIERSDYPKLAGISDWFLDFGFTLTQEKPVYCLEHVEFCQAQPVQAAGGWRMVRNPFVAMSKDSISLLGWDNEVSIQVWAAAIGDCGLSLTMGIPVWQEWYSRLVRIGAGQNREGASRLVCDSGLGYMSSGVKPCNISAECRVSFWKAFGILPDLQEALEAEYRDFVSLGSLTPMICPDIIAIDKQCNSLARCKVAR